MVCATASFYPALGSGGTGEMPYRVKPVLLLPSLGAEGYCR